jgi:aryl-alcohol dehydrogenase-like predicted oxidoreductase
MAPSGVWCSGSARLALTQKVNVRHVPPPPFSLRPERPMSGTVRGWYGHAEKYLAPILMEHRARLFVVTKTSEQSRQAVMDSIAESLSRLDAPRVDAVLLNNIGDYDLRKLFRADGALAGLKEARCRGQVRSLGRFERDILPVAAKHDVGVVAMKTLGGAVGLKYDTRQQRAILPERHHRLAIRYVLGLPRLC